MKYKVGDVLAETKENMDELNIIYEKAPESFFRVIILSYRGDGVLIHSKAKLSKSTLDNYTVKANPNQLRNMIEKILVSNEFIYQDFENS